MVGRNRLVLVGLLCLGVVAVAVLLAPVALRRPKPFSAESVTLPDGSIFRIAAITSGTNHVVGPPLSHLVHRFAPSAQLLLIRLLGSRAAPLASTTTPRPALVIWLEDVSHRTNAVSSAGYCEAFLADASGFVSGESAHVQSLSLSAIPQSLTFYAAPRRDRVISLEFYHHAGSGTVTRSGHLNLKNPFYGQYPQWQPQPLPATNYAGDVEVVIRRLSTGHADHSASYFDIGEGSKAIEFGTNRVDGRNRSICLCTFRPLTRTNEVWCVASEQVSDATSNCLNNTSLGWGGYGDGYFTFAPGLWTGESAWKLKCEIKRAKGFAPEETVSFRDIPLGRLDSTNLIGWMTNFSGASISLDQIVRRPPNTNSSWSSSDASQVHFTVATTNGLHVDLVSACADNGTNLECGSWDSGGDKRRYTFRAIPLDANAADFTFSVHRSRWVEFMLKPEVGPSRFQLEPRSGM